MGIIEQDYSSGVKETGELVIPKAGLASSMMIMPRMTSDLFISRTAAIHEFVDKCLTEGIDNDYGLIPGTKKKTLLLPGAQKFERFFGLNSKSILAESIIDPFGVKLGTAIPFYFFRYETEIIFENLLVHVGHGSASSQENKWGFKWIDIEQVPEDQRKNYPSRDGSRSEFDFAIKEAKTEGKYGKPQEYWDEWKKAIIEGRARKFVKQASTGREFDAWELGSIQLRIPNDDVGSQVNTMQKISKKRSYVDGIIYACAISDLFTQDLEDYQEGPQWNAASSSISFNQPKTAEKPVETSTTAVAPGEPPAAAELPAIDEPRQVAGSPQRLPQQPQQAPSRAAAPAPPAGRSTPPASAKKQEKPKDLFAPNGEPQKTQENKVDVSDLYTPPDGNLTAKVTKQHIDYLSKRCDELGLAKRWVKKWVAEYFEGREVKDLNYVQFKVTVEEFLNKGLVSEKQVKSIENLALANKKNLQDVSNFVVEKFNKPINFMYPSEVIETMEWIQQK